MICIVFYFLNIRNTAFIRLSLLFLKIDKRISHNHQAFTGFLKYQYSQNFYFNPLIAD